MRRTAWTILAALLLSECLIAGEPVVLDEGSPFRAHYTWRTPVVRKDGALKEVTRRFGWKDLICITPFPPAGWQSPDFDDANWARWPGMALKSDAVGKKKKYVYGVGSYPFKPFEDTVSPCLALLSMRGRFTVTRPAPMKLSMKYRGGVVVYLNGKELVRANLPKEGKVAPETLATDYPDEAHLGSNGKPFHFYSSSWPKIGGAERMPLRIRKLENVEIPTSMLVKGVNLLALEFHRSVHHARRKAANWSTCSLLSLSLTGAGAQANSSRPGGVQVWACNWRGRLTVLDYADPNAPPQPVKIVGARGGAFNGRLVVSSKSDLKGLRVSPGDLVRKEGGTIPASAIGVFYARPADVGIGLQPRSMLWSFDTLLPAAPATVPASQSTRAGRGRAPGAVQPVWVKVRVPRKAAPGKYRGTLQVSGPVSTKVRVELLVADWQLPDSRDFSTHMALVQSPDSVAIRYKVPLWSEKHFKLLEESFKLLGQVGNRHLWVPLICRTNFGNSETMVRWTKHGSGWKHDFSVLERYLDLALKYTDPDVVCLYVWDKYAGGDRVGKFAGTESPVKISVLENGKVKTVDGPKYSNVAAARAFWKPVVDEVRSRLAKRNLAKAVLLGMFSENGRPRKGTVQLFSELLPGARWIENGHPKIRSLHGNPVGYHTNVYVNLFAQPPEWDSKRKSGWQLPVKADIFPRSGGPATADPLYPAKALGLHLATCEAALLANHSGMGRVGLDFWPMPSTVAGKRRHGGRSIQARYPESAWSQLDFYTATESLTVPGPKGALPTVRFERLRESLQTCEARIYIERALYDPAKKAKLGGALVAKCQETLDERARMLRAACIARGWTWYEAVIQDLDEKLFATAAQVAAKLDRK